MDAAASRSTLAAALRPVGVRNANTITSISLCGRTRVEGASAVAAGRQPALAASPAAAGPAAPFPLPHL